MNNLFRTLFTLGSLVSVTAYADCSKMDYAELKDKNTENQVSYFCKVASDYWKISGHRTVIQNILKEAYEARYYPKDLEKEVKIAAEKSAICSSEYDRVLELLKSKNVVPACDCPDYKDPYCKKVP